MGFNLTNEQIQNTYQQLVQVSGSTLVNGTGSAIAFSVPTASYAITASYALNGGGGATVDTGSLMVTASAALNVVTFTKGDGTTFNVTVNTGSTDISGKLNTSVFVAYTASNDLAVAAKLNSTTFNAYTSSNDSAVSAKLATSTFTSYSSSMSTRLTSDETSINALNAATSSYLTSIPSGVVSSSAQTVANLVGQNVSVAYLSATSASIGHIDFVTGSATIIGDAFIILNNSTPTQVLAGISVVDSGSTATTSSFLWDGASNDWKYQYHLGADHENAVALFASGSMIGTTVYPATNKLQKGGGNHHLYDSNITDNGSKVSTSTSVDITGSLIVTTNVTASAFKGDGSGLTNVGVSATASFTNQSTWNFVHGLGKDLLNIQTYNTNYEQIIPTNIDLVSSTQATITFPFNVSGYAVATLGGGTSTGAGTSVVKSANAFYDARTFLIDAPGTFASTPIDVHISQSGLYVISASQQPPYAANGPRVNLYWYPDSIGYGETSKVKFWIPSKDTGNGVTYKNNVTSTFTGNNYWGWNSTTKPEAANSASISRPGLASAFSLATGTLVNTMVRDGDGFVYFNLGTTDPSAQYYFFSGSSTAPMV